MKKIRVTKKDIKEGWRFNIKAGYCDLQYLLHFKDADFYTAGVYGWSADIYKINYSTVIVTGYSPFGNCGNYEIIEKYENEAKKVLDDRTLSIDQQKEKLDELISKFVDECINKE